MKLDEYELDYVKYFVQSKGYHEYEVLGEILDHFILLIEERRLEDRNASFKDLVNEVYNTVGKSTFEGIRVSAKKVVRKKYNLIFFENLFLFLHYRYLLITLTAGFLFYQLQFVLTKFLEFNTIHLMFWVLIVIFAAIYMRNNSVNPKFLVAKVASGYGFYLVLATGFLYRIIIRSIENTDYFGINLHYLVSTIAIILQTMIVYAIAKTAEASSKECDEMEEVYQVLK